MKAEDKKHFFEVLYSAQEIIFTFHGIKFCVQGYYDDNGTAHMNLQQWFPEIDEIIWECAGNNMVECGDKFLDMPLFEGKSFGEVETEIDWVDD